MSTFSAQVADWVKNEQGYLEAVVRESAQRVVDEMQRTKGEGGNLPLDTGYLRASLLASTDTMPTIREDATPKEGATYAYDAGPINLVINGMKAGTIIYFGYVASYARRICFGFTGKDKAGRQYSQQGNPWVLLVAQRWPQIVEQVQAELAQRLGR